MGLAGHALHEAHRAQEWSPMLGTIVVVSRSETTASEGAITVEPTEPWEPSRWWHWLIVGLCGLVQCVLATAVLWFFLGYLPSIKP